MFQSLSNNCQRRQELFQHSNDGNLPSSDILHLLNSSGVAPPSNPVYPADIENTASIRCTAPGASIRLAPKRRPWISLHLSPPERPLANPIKVIGNDVLFAYTDRLIALQSSIGSRDYRNEMQEPLYTLLHISSRLQCICEGSTKEEDNRVRRSLDDNE